MIGDAIPVAVAVGGSTSEALGKTGRPEMMLISRPLLHVGVHFATREEMERLPGNKQTRIRGSQQSLLHFLFLDGGPGGQQQSEGISFKATKLSTHWRHRHLELYTE